MSKKDIPAANVGPTPPLFPSAKVVWTHIPSDEGADVGCPARSGQHGLNAPVDALALVPLLYLMRNRLAPL